MASRFTIIPNDTFDGLQLDAGIITKNFDITNPNALTADDVITATTGGIQVSCAATYSDFGEDVDNCPNNMKELKHLDGWDCTMAFTAINTTKESIRLELGAADIDANTGAITPRKDLEQTDFCDIWWVGDKANGGFVAILLKNALSTDGFSLQTSKNQKGQISTTLTGHVSIASQKVMPMVIYSIDEDADYESATESFTGDGAKTEFTLAHKASRIFNVKVGGAPIESSMYSIGNLGLSLIFATAPADESVISVSYSYKATT